jgi:hypothetical protein
VKNKFPFVFFLGRGAVAAFNTLATIVILRAVSWLRQLVVRLLLWMPRFNPRSVYIRFMVEKVALWHVFLWLFQFYSVSIIPPVFQTYLHFNVNNIRTTSEWGLGTFKLKGAISDTGELCTIGQNCTFTLLLWPFILFVLAYSFEAYGPSLHHWKLQVDTVISTSNDRHKTLTHTHTHTHT